MKKLLGLCVLAMGILRGGVTAFAAGPEEPRQEALDRGAFEVGVRVGFGLPAGKVGGLGYGPDPDLSHVTPGIVPLIIDVGYRVDRSFYLGLSLQYAFGFVNTEQNAFCENSGVSCSVGDLRIGLNFHYHLALGLPVDPWVGFGVGYEWLLASTTGPGYTDSQTASGFELANFQLGVDIAGQPKFALGPFVSVSFGDYGGISQSDGPSGTFGRIEIHSWILLGVRGVYDVPRHP